MKKNILISLTKKIDENIEQNIEKLKLKKHFNNVKWPKVKEAVRMHDLKKQFRQYENLHLHGQEEQLENEETDKVQKLKQMNAKIKTFQ